MGTVTDQPAVPYQPPAPMPGTPPSGIASNRDIRGMANKAKQTVTSRQQNFLAMMRDSAPQVASQPVPQPMTPVQKFANAAAGLVTHRDSIDKFVDWVLFG